MFDSTVWAWPQWVFLGALTLSTGMSLSAYAGTKVGGESKFLLSLVSTAATLALLYFGHYFGRHC